MNPQRRMTLTTPALLGLAAMLAWGELVAPTAQARRGASMEQANKVLARRYYEEVLNQGNLAAIDELVAPDEVAHGIAGTRPGQAAPAGREQLKRAVPRLRGIFPDVHYTIEDQIAEGDKVVSRWTRRGTQKGEWPSTLFGTIAPTGKEVTTNGVTILRIVDGKIAEAWVSQDLLGTFQQLGVIPPAPAAAAR